MISFSLGGEENLDIYTMMCLLFFVTCLALVHEFAYGVPVMDMRKLINEQKRQHWTVGLKPGGKRSFGSEENGLHPNLGLAGDTTGFEAMLDDAEAQLYENSNHEHRAEPVDNLQETKRQHWTIGLSPGGKREFVEDKRQHWTTGLSPGGKREYDEDSEVHMAPGGQQYFDMYDTEQPYGDPSRPLNIRNVFSPSEAVVEDLERLIRAIAKYVSPFPVHHESSNKNGQEIISSRPPVGFPGKHVSGEPTMESSPYPRSDLRQRYESS